jgi:hypothetical protein
MEFEEAYKTARKDLENLEFSEEDRDAVLAAKILQNLGGESSGVEKIGNESSVDIEWDEVPYQSGSLSYNILELIEEGFFEEFKTTEQIYQELQRKAISCSSTKSLSSPLRRVVKRGYLSRKKKEDENGDMVWHYAVGNH